MCTCFYSGHISLSIIAIIIHPWRAVVRPEAFGEMTQQGDNILNKKFYANPVVTIHKKVRF